MATTTNGSKCIFGVFETRMDLENTVDNFKAQGFRSSDLSVLVPDDGDGLEEGDTFGGALGWLSDVRTVIIPKVGSFLAAGVILESTDMESNNSETDLASILKFCGIPKDETRKYESYLKEGGMLILVHADDTSWMNKARMILESGGARDVTSGPQRTIPKQRPDVPLPAEPYL